MNIKNITLYSILISGFFLMNPVYALRISTMINFAKNLTKSKIYFHKNPVSLNNSTSKKDTCSLSECLCEKDKHIAKVFDQLKISSEYEFDKKDYFRICTSFENSKSFPAIVVELLVKFNKTISNHYKSIINQKNGCLKINEIEIISRKLRNLPIDTLSNIDWLLESYKGWHTAENRLLFDW